MEKDSKDTIDDVLKKIREAIETVESRGTTQIEKFFEEIGKHQEVVDQLLIDMYKTSNTRNLEEMPHCTRHTNWCESIVRFSMNVFGYKRDEVTDKLAGRTVCFYIFGKKIHIFYSLLTTAYGILLDNGFIDLHPTGRYAWTGDIFITKKGEQRVKEFSKSGYKPNLSRIIELKPEIDYLYKIR